MQIVTTVDSLRQILKPLSKEGKVIGLVPTMGALHDGHGALIKESVKDCDITVVSVFLNPIQFGKNEDLDKYPKRLEADAKFAGSLGADYVFAPSVQEMYPDGDPLTLVRDETLESLYCGAYRPGHFRGVLTVVSKLFLISGCDHAYFGEKDYQQLAMIRRMVADMNMPIRILGGPIVREPDGLAMSSRNAYLDAESRPSALSLSEGLALARKMYAQGERDGAAIIQAVERHILSKPQTKIDYVALIDGDTLEPVDQADDRTRLALAVHVFDKVRLIDNGALAAAQ